MIISSHQAKNGIDYVLVNLLHNGYRQGFSKPTRARKEKDPFIHTYQFMKVISLVDIQITTRDDVFEGVIAGGYRFNNSTHCQRLFTDIFHKDRVLLCKRQKLKSIWFWLTV